MLVDQAGVTMTEVVGSIKRVTDIMGETSAASTQQSAGVARVGEAVTQLNQATQRNAALVDDSAAAAESMKTQAQQLVQAVSAFKLSHGEPSHVVAAVALAKSFATVERRGSYRARNVVRPSFKAAPHRSGITAGSPEPNAAQVKNGTDDWESF